MDEEEGYEVTHSIILAVGVMGVWGEEAIDDEFIEVFSFFELELGVFDGEFEEPESIPIAFVVDSFREWVLEFPLIEARFQGEGLDMRVIIVEGDMGRGEGGVGMGFLVGRIEDGGREANFWLGDYEEGKDNEDGLKHRKPL